MAGRDRPVNAPVALVAPSDPPPPDASPVDGRSARRDRNRLAVIDAVVELFVEGNLRPDPEQVARRCGLSTRSVRRYFESDELLLRAAVERQIEVGIPLYRLHGIGRGPLADRIRKLVTMRMDAYERLGSTVQAANMMAVRSAVVRENFAFVREMLTDQIEKQFAPELSGLPKRQHQAAALAVDALLQFETFDHYRLRRGLSPRQTIELLVIAVSRVLEPSTGGQRGAPARRH